MQHDVLAQRRALTDNTYRKLWEGGTSCDASRDAWSILLGLRQTVDYSVADVIDLALKQDAPGLRHYARVARKRGHGAAIKKIHREWTKAGTWVAQHPAAPDNATVQAAITSIIGIADTHPELFGSRTRKTDRIVLANVARIMRDAGRIEMPISVRCPVLKSAIRTGTVAISLKRLTQIGFLTKTAEHHGTKAARYRLQAPVVATTDDLSDAVTLPRHSDAVLGDLHDALGWWGVDRGPAITYALLSQVEATSAGVARPQRCPLCGSTRRVMTRRWGNVEVGVGPRADSPPTAGLRSPSSCSSRRC
jgi:hypothetical protein